MKMKFLLSIFFSLLISVMSVMAVPAYRKPFVVKQSDGTELTVILTGDEALHYYVTLDGKPLVKEANGDYSYATFSNSGIFVSTKHLAHNAGSRSAAEKDLLLSIDNEEMNVRISKTAVSRSSKYKSAAKKAGSQIKPEGDINVAVLLVQFKDTKFTYTKEDVENILNTKDYVYENKIANSIGSARDYFIAQSDGKFRPNFLVTDIVTLDNVMSYYGANKANGDDTRPTHMIKEGIAKADANFDFSKCDNDGDGEVEFVYCIYAGYSESYGADENTIWPHKWQLSAQSGSITIDGVKCNTYACSSELILNETNEENYGKMLNGIGTVCHEFSHCLGLPDIYDPTYESVNFCMDFWDLMDQGSYVGEGYIPVGYSAYQRDFCGWRDLVVLESPGKYSMKALTQGGIGYKILNDANPDEYYILENRKQEGWDSGIFNEGMLVVHVDYLKSAWDNNTVNTVAGHPRYTIIPADNDLAIYGTVTNAQFRESLQGDVWPGTKGNVELTNNSIPAAEVYTGEYMNKPITDIKYENNVISFTFIENSDWIFDVIDGVNTLVGYNGNDTEIILPDNYNGEKYVIGEGVFENNTTITRVTIPNSVTSIGDRAFYDCSGLTSIVIPNSVTSIGESAFANSGLTSILIPNSVVNIGIYAFMYCSELTSIIVEEGNTRYDSRNNCNAFIETATNTLIRGCKNTKIPGGVTSIGSSAFEDCYALTNIEIPNSVTSIGDFAFDGCVKLADVTIPNSVTSIGECAFQNCSGLKSVVIPNSVTSIGIWAFLNCSGLKTIINFSNLTFTKGSTDYGYVAYYADKVMNLPNGFIEDDFAFAVIDDVKTLVSYWGNNTDIVLPENCKGENYIIGDNAFKDNTTITKITIPNSVTSIGKDAFYDCTGLTAVYIDNLASWCNIDFANYSANPLVRAKNLCLNGETVTELVIPDNISEIKQYTFLDCSTLTKVTIPGSVTTIGNYAFSGCVELADVTIPNSVTSIGSYAFSYCSGLTSVVIGNSVTSIGDCAFQKCTLLAEIIIPNSVTKIGDKAFFECKNLKSVINCSELIIKKGSVDNGMVGFYADKIINLPNNFDSIEGDFVFAVIDGVNTLVSYIGNDTEITLPESYKGESYVIGKNAFKENATITKITIPNSVTSIEDEAFYDCTGLTAVYIDNLAAWCNMEFATPESNPLYYARNLYLYGELVKELVVPGNVSAVKQYAFYNCSEITNIVIPNCVTSIGESAFSGCSKTEGLYLGNSIESIGDNAFAGCNGLLEIRNSSIIAIECNENIFSSNTYNNAMLYVPEGRKEFYEKVTPWNKFIMNELNSTDYLFTITYMVNDNAYYTYALKQGEAVPSPLVTIEGYTFNGWDALPDSMPAKDIIVYGSFKADSYIVTFVVDGKEYETISVEYGNEIPLPVAPEKEGHTFVGWNEVPGTMPAENITIEATFAVNSYNVTFYVDGEKYHEEAVEFGAEIPSVNTPVKNGYIFSGWNYIPETMPARDIIIYGYFKLEETGVDEVELGNYKEEIYNLKGERVINSGFLPKGLYIINGKKVIK